MVTVQRLEAAFGAEVTGLDLAAGVDAPTMRVLTEALYENQVLLIRGQRLDPDAYLAFGREWGTPIPHVLDHLRMPGYPEMLVIGNTEEKDRDPAVRNGAALWHTDQSYEVVPASATMLYALEVPARGGETQYCNMAAAYAGLDAATRARIDRLEVAHKYGRGRLRPDEQAAVPIASAEQDGRVPVIHHPLVLHHPITGRRVLYGIGHGAHAIRGMPDAEADALLESLKDHALEERYLYRHRYAVGDIAIWDTLQTMHRATPIDVARGNGDARRLWRISVRGKPRIYEP